MVVASLSENIKQRFLSLRRDVIEKEFSKLNPTQKKAAFHTEGPLLILAGAGSGKTTVLIQRIANIIRFGSAYESDWTPPNLTQADVDLLENVLADNIALTSDIAFRASCHPAQAWQILAITFTNKAAGELKERLRVMLGTQGDDVWASTFHATCARFLRRDGDRIGFTSHFTVYDADDSRRLMKDCQKSLGIEEKVLPVKAVLSEISRAKDQMLSPGDYAKTAENDYRKVKIAEAYAMYQKRLRDGDAMDFDDLLYNAVHLLESCPDVLERYQERFHYILVDEYQDTNTIQYRLIRLLAGNRKNLCVVGDDDQSIYKFRGATIKNILYFENEYPGAVVIRLEQNYRSTQNILAAANAVIANNEERKGKSLWTENGAGDLLSLHAADNEQDEASFIVDTVIEHASNGRSYSDFAVLYRMNAQSNTIEKNLVKSGIPYRIIGGHRFYERKEIKDMIAYLSVIGNPHDEVRLRRIINEPKRTIGDKTVNTAAEIATELGVSLFDVLTHADEYERLQRSAVKLMQFGAMLSELIAFNQAHETSLHELYTLLLEKSGYLRVLDPHNEEQQGRIENIQELASNLLGYETDHEGDISLSGFLEEVSLMTDIDNYNADSSAVVLMTMHSAKGLEFPFVFLPGFEEGIFPGFASILNPAEIEEERRLAYVGITRAKEKLYILNADSRMLYGTTNRNKVSRFAMEIPDELTEKTRTRRWQKLDSDARMPEDSKLTRIMTTQAARNIGTGHASPPVSSAFLPGDKVSHKSFGIGKVLRVTAMGNDSLLEISFDQAGTKKLMSNFARLSKA